MSDGADRDWRFTRTLRIGRRVLIRAAAVLAALYVVALGALYAFQRDLVFIGVRWSDEDPRPPGFVERTVFEPDGTHLRIWQSGPPTSGKPTIVFFYGNAGTLSDFADLGEVLNAEGYGVVLGSYRGYSRNPGSPSERGLFADARAILNAVPADYGPIVAWGQSLGTGVAAAMAAEGRVSGLILQSPYTAIVDIAAMAYPLFPVRLLDRDPFDTLSLVPKIRVPVLIIHGTDDRTVPFWMGETLAHQLGREATFVPIRHGGHNDLSDDELAPAADSWLAAHAKQISRAGASRRQSGP